ncbi:DUF4855 domain-containing protein [Alicyclobacillus fastidiosus]|uniref:DUF4855 domain-containing protein n=1 Tax=Alicyclobacillus fastidiosus TaxID=392011 RepID=A0ABY6ZER9_9BACL|nr:DUF4855 domain-containing protein [Alicyclobacillus fastidiosus]WAH40616.1 DUF4855 domain-containing protein [Alicyclobacillus fastidiosus]GMA62059.1 hypothetical protein GCM10025859_24990 [Alicyclobacillus fastidiosus]
MQKTILTTAAAVLLACSPLFVVNAFADDTSTSSTPTSTTGTSSTTDTNTDGIDTLQGIDTSVLRPGADPNNPDSYAYLPLGMSIPVAGPRTEWPAVPSVSTSTSPSSGSTSNTTVQVAQALSAPNQNDPNTEPDIALGKPYTIGTQWPDATFATDEASFADKGQLTDGQFATLSYEDPQYTGFLRQGGRSITVNLGSVQEVDSVSLDFMQNLGAGIDFPERVTYYASDDGTTWHKLGSAVTTQGGGSYVPQTQPYTIDTHVQAQYIRAQFEDNVFSFVDQFSVYGPAQGKGPGGNNGNGNPLPGPALSTMMGNNYLYDPSEPKLLSIQQEVQTFASPTGPAGQPGPDQGQSMSALSTLGLPMGPSSANAQTGGNPNSTLPNPGYLTSNDPGTDGIKNLYLAYTGAPNNTATDSVGRYTVSDWLPYVAQLDASGNPQGWLFDGVLFGPYGTPQNTTTINNWLTDLFSPNINLSALNQAVGQLKQQLNDPNYVEKVVINIPGMDGITPANESNYGSIDSSGQNIDLNPADVGEVQSELNKSKVIRWFIQTVLNDWNSAGLSNLQLAGFYWQPESINAADPLEPSLIQYTANVVHQNGYKFFWIPFYGTNYGLDEWRQLGFDDVTSQAGVAFNFSINAQARLQSVAQMAQFYHIGLEMEQPYNTMSSNTTVAQNSLNHFYDYFTGGYVYGYEGNAEKTWYINAKGLTGPYQSTNPFYHAQYDNVVKFINGQWTGTTFY